MTVKKYRKIPVCVDALKYIGNNWKELFNFVGATGFVRENNLIIKTLKKLKGKKMETMYE